MISEELSCELPHHFYFIIGVLNDRCESKMEADIIRELLKHELSPVIHGSVSVCTSQLNCPSFRDIFRKTSASLGLKLVSAAYQLFKRVHASCKEIKS